MPAMLISGTEVASRFGLLVQTRAADFLRQWGRQPSLHVVLVGEDPASQVYVHHKQKAAATRGIASEVHRLPAATTQQQLHRLLAQLSADASIDGVLLQLPLPAGLDADAALQRLDPAKDVDGLHPLNAGQLALGQPGLRPCTPLGCMALLQAIEAPLSGLEALIIGRSRLVGMPMARLLLEQHATVTVAHSRSRDLPMLLQRAELVVAAAGQPGLVRGEWLRQGAVVLDVGIHRRADGSLCGDVDFPSAVERAGWITPVPGGVGPMTIAMLLRNTVDAAEARARTAANG